MAKPEVSPEVLEDLKFLFKQMGIMDYAWDNARIAKLAKKYGLTREECPIFVTNAEWRAIDV